MLKERTNSSNTRCVFLCVAGKYDESGETGAGEIILLIVVKHLKDNKLAKNLTHPVLTSTLMTTGDVIKEYLQDGELASHPLGATEKILKISIIGLSASPTGSWIADTGFLSKAS